MKHASKRTSGLMLFLCTLIFSSPAFAGEADLMSMIRDLQSQMKQMQKTIGRQNDEIRELKNRGANIQAAPQTGEAPKAASMSDYEFNQMLDAATGGAQKWLKDLSLKGDLRLRYEAFDFHTGNPTNDDSRNRFRLRLRYGFEKKFNDDMKIGFSMASGESSGGVQNDPTSTNATFDKLFNFKNIFIEKAYATYAPSWAKIGPVEKLTLTGGKMDNPFEKGSSDMVWDRDVKPEGAAEKIDFKAYESSDVKVKGYVTAGQFVLDEDATTGTGDAELYAYQAGINPIIYTPWFERPVEWLSAVSYYYYSDYSAASNFLIDNATNLSGATAANQRGNINSSGLTNELDAGAFKVFENYHELSLDPYGLPVRPFYDFVINLQDSEFVNADDIASAFGLKLGGINKKGDWELSYAYKRIEHASVVGAFNDSDFGLGHADKRGSVFKAGYALTDGITLNGAAFFVNNLNTGTFGIPDEEQRRFQLDMNWKF